MGAAPKLISQTETKIDKGVPRPAPATRNGKYPWAQMEVGDSFYVEGQKRSSLHATASSWAARHRLSSKFCTADEGTGVRIWLIA